MVGHGDKETILDYPDNGYIGSFSAKDPSGIPNYIILIENDQYTEKDTVYNPTIIEVLIIGYYNDIHATEIKPTDIGNISKASITNLIPTFRSLYYKLDDFDEEVKELHQQLKIYSNISIAFFAQLTTEIVNIILPITSSNINTEVNLVNIVPANNSSRYLVISASLYKVNNLNLKINNRSLRAKLCANNLYETKFNLSNDVLTKLSFYDVVDTIGDFSNIYLFIKSNKPLIIKTSYEDIQFIEDDHDNFTQQKILTSEEKAIYKLYTDDINLLSKNRFMFVR